MTNDENKSNTDSGLPEPKMAMYTVGIEDGIYDVLFDVDAHRYKIVNRESGREVCANITSFTSLGIMDSVRLDKGEYHILFDVDAHRYRLVDQKSGREFYADARAFFVEDYETEDFEEGM